MQKVSNSCISSVQDAAESLLHEKFLIPQLHGEVGTKVLHTVVSLGRCSEQKGGAEAVVLRVVTLDKC